MIVVGHPECYPRFGFRPANGYGITCEWDVPDDVFMALVLDAARMAAVAGVASYRPEFVAGLSIGTALGWTNAATIALAVVLAFASGFALTAVARGAS